MAKTYDIVFHGKRLPGTDIRTAGRNLEKMFGIDREKAAQILSSRGILLKKGLEEIPARKYVAALKKAGLSVALVESGSGKNTEKVVPDGPTPPKGAAPAGAPARKTAPETDSGGGRASATVKEPPPQPPPGPSGHRTRIPFRFHGSGSAYFKIWLVNVILSIVTLGIYSAWAKVRRKQYFYGCTRIREASFDYLADPVKILKGRLIVGGIFIVYSALSNLVPIAGFVLSLAFMVILPWIVVRALAFNAHNSALRNIRFGFHGTFTQAAKVYLLWPLLAAVTLGALLPYAYFSQKKFVVENTSFGRTRFAFGATVRDYYGIFIRAMVPMLVGIGAAVGCAFLLPPLSAVVILVLYLYLMAYFSVKTTNLLFNAISLGPHRMAGRLKTVDYAILVATNTLAVAVTLGLFHPWAKVRTVRYKLEHIVLTAAGDLDGFVAAEQQQVSAVGDEMSDFMDFDFGL